MTMYTVRYSMSMSTSIVMMGIPAVGCIIYTVMTSILGDPLSARRVDMVVFIIFHKTLPRLGGPLVELASALYERGGRRAMGRRPELLMQDVADRVGRPGSFQKWAGEGPIGGCGCSPN
jgi:hypothetical protein